MKALPMVLLLWAVCGACAQDYRLPFEGQWFVMQGGQETSKAQTSQAQAAAAHR